MKKKIHNIIIVASLFICSSINGFAETIDVTLTTESQEIENDEHSKGHRIPPRPICCNIDSEAGTITLSKDIEAVISYEIWDESATACLAYYADEAAFIDHLFTIPGDYQIRIVTDDYTYTGYVSTL